MTEAPLGIDRLDWDSAFFGLPIGRIRRERLNDEDAERCAAEARRQGIRCVYYLAPADDPGSWRAAIRAGFDPIDVRIELERKSASDSSRLRDENTCRTAAEPDASALLALAEDAFTESRFFRDDRFPRGKARELFRTWVRRGIGDPEGFALLRSSKSEPEGFITGRVNSGAGRIDLVCVSTRLHRQGIGRALISAALGEFARRGTTHVRVVTQGANEAAQRLYQSAGFRTRSVALWFHGWF